MSVWKSGHPRKDTMRGKCGLHVFAGVACGPGGSSSRIRAPLVRDLRGGREGPAPASMLHWCRSCGLALDRELLPVSTLDSSKAMRRANSSS